MFHIWFIEFFLNRQPSNSCDEERKMTIGLHGNNPSVIKWNILELLSGHLALKDIMEENIISLYWETECNLK